METIFVTWLPQEFRWSKQKVEGLAIKILTYFPVKAWKNFSYILIFSKKVTYCWDYIMLKTRVINIFMGRTIRLAQQAIVWETPHRHLYSASAIFPRAGHPYGCPRRVRGLNIAKSQDNLCRNHACEYFLREW